jgi:hypothetical protein
MLDVGYVQKTKTRTLHYSFASESDLIKTLRPALIAHQITIHPAGIADLRTETYTTSSGTTMNHTIGRFTFHIHHTASDTGLDVEVLGEGADVGDKSANKAMTAAFKYALRQTFVIETGDDPDYTNSAGQARRGNGHWISRREVFEAFWGFCGTLDLDEQQVYRALDVDSIEDYPGSMRAAKLQLEAYAAQLKTS